MADELAELPEPLQAIISADESAETQQLTVSHRIEFSYDGVSLALFESTGLIHIPAQGQIIEIHGVEVAVTEVSLNYAAYDGVPVVIATAEVEPVEGS